MATTSEHNCKKLLTINIHGMPRTSSNRDCYSLAQRNKADAKVKTTSERRKGKFDKIKQHANETKHTNDASIAGDCDQSTESKEIGKFHEDASFLVLIMITTMLEKMSHTKQMQMGQHQQILQRHQMAQWSLLKVAN